MHDLSPGHQPQFSEQLKFCSNLILQPPNENWETPSRVCIPVSSGLEDPGSLKVHSRLCSLPCSGGREEDWPFLLCIWSSLSRSFSK